MTVRFVAVTTAAVAWTGLILGAPLVAGVAEALSGLVYTVGAVVCHQIPERSFHLGGHQLPVCARCLGVYAGAAVGLLAWGLSRPSRRGRWPVASARRVVVVSAAPTVVTVLTAWAGAGDPANPWRAALALPLGMAAGLVVGAAATDHLQ
jgi:uncharacterized membrane protein